MSARVGSPPTRAGSTTDAASKRARDVGARVLVGLVLVVAAVLWTWPRGALWLDEAQSVAIARRSASGIVDGLRADGAPPLYYGILHVWMAVVGDGEQALRALSALFAAVALAVVALVVRRLAGGTAALVAVAVFAVHPFVVRYASETRMYALVMLEVALLVLLLDTWLRGGGQQRTLWWAIALTTTALMLTHYWAFPFVAAGWVLAVGCWWRGRRAGLVHDRRMAGHVALALTVGALGAAPWLPVLRFQSAHTGTPWADPPSIVDAVRVLFHRGTGPTWIAVAVSVVGAALLLVGSTPRRSTSPAEGPAVQGGLTSGLVAAHFWLTAGMTFAVARVTDSAFMPRYTSVLFPSAVVLLAVGWGVVPWRVARGALVALLCAGSVVVAVEEVRSPRTRAAAFAEAIERGASPDDVVVFCPDQLGPSISRIMRRSDLALHERVFPEGRADRVDWIDYRERHESASPARFVTDAIGLAGDGAIWLVLSETYPPTQAACSGVLAQLIDRTSASRVVIPDDPGWRDHDQLWWFRP